MPSAHLNWRSHRDFILFIGRPQNEPDTEHRSFLQNLYEHPIPRSRWPVARTRIGSSTRMTMPSRILQHAFLAAASLVAGRMGFEASPGQRSRHVPDAVVVQRGTGLARLAALCGTGTIGDWYCHVMDPTFWALDLDAPSTVAAEVTDYDPAKHGLTYPPAAKITFEFPARGQGGPVNVVWHDGGNRIPKPQDFAADDQAPGTGAILFGDQGMIVHGSHGGGGCRLLPEKLMDQYSGKNAPAEQIARVKNPAWDWAEAIRTGRQAGSHFGYGGPLTQAALLGAIAIRFPGQTLRWDNTKAMFNNHDRANAYVHPEYRPGWSL